MPLATQTVVTRSNPPHLSVRHAARQCMSQASWSSRVGYPACEGSSIGTISRRLFFRGSGRSTRGFVKVVVLEELGNPIGAHLAEWSFLHRKVGYCGSPSPTNPPSYLHGHSGMLRASSRHSGGKGRLRESDADHGSARLLGRPRDPLPMGSRLQTHGPAAGPGGRREVSCW